MEGGRALQTARRNWGLHWIVPATQIKEDLDPPRKAPATPAGTILACRAVNRHERVCELPDSQLVFHVLYSQGLAGKQSEVICGCSQQEREMDSF